MEKRKQEKMNLIIRKLAQSQISKVVKYVEEENTEGAGDRWLQKLRATFDQIAQTEVKYSICKNEHLSKQNFRCFTYNDKWVVAYKITDGKFIICRFIWGAKLI
jgi:plasmid stabilization system protein ParE